MQSDRQKIEKRLGNIKNTYLKLDKMIDSLPEEVPDGVRDIIKDKILGDKNLKALMDGIDNHRPPRFLLVGRTGAGKSSLINAITGFYSAQVSDTESCTPGIEICNVYEGNDIIMQLLDTRGIAESNPIDDLSAENQLLDQINEFSPDAAIFLLSCSHRDSVGDDAEFCKQIVDAYQGINQIKLPIVVVANKADEVSPGRFKEPDHYPENKINNIEEIVRNYKYVLDKHGVKYEKAIAVSSYIEWMTPEGEEVDADKINNMTDKERENLQISFDGRYQIEELRDILEDVIEDFQAKMGFRMALRFNVFLDRITTTVTRTFAGISATIGLSPIPFSDVFVLIPLQIAMVMIIVSLSGKDVSFETAKEFVVSMFGVGSLGALFRLGAQQIVKFANLIIPGAGSVASGAVAMAGTITMGKAAKAYFINGQSKDIVRKMALKTKEFKNKKWESIEKLTQSDIKEIDRQIDELFK